MLISRELEPNCIAGDSKPLDHFRSILGSRHLLYIQKVMEGNIRNKLARWYIVPDYEFLAE
jgi:hypothetical protein